MSIISLKSVSHNFGDNDIFDKISLSLEHNSRIGLVGKNGSGKTTLFKIMMQKLTPRQGEVHIAGGKQILYLTQEPELDEEQSLYDCVLESRHDWLFLQEKLSKAEIELARNQSSENIAKYASIIAEFEQIDGYFFQTRLKLVLTHLNFPEETWNKKIKRFSGGEKTRIQLARFLLQPFDAILLDEPTNHLDLEMIYWLADYLQRINKPYIIISHDRFFLDATVDKIIEIKDRKLHHYGGNFSFYQEEFQRRATLQEKEFNNQQKMLKQMDDQIKQYRIWGKARDSKVMFKRAKELEKRKAKIDVIEKPSNKKAINLNINTIGRSGNDVYVLENLTFGFPEKILAKNVNMRIGYQDRTAVLGRNGCGKTTFLRILNKEFEPLSGTARKGASLNIGYYDQMHLILDDSLSVMETIWQLVPLETQGYVLSFLARYGFRGDDVDKKVENLSGGEKSRLYLAKLIHQKPNLLILDEPTNHLDIEMIGSLEKALLDYDGTIVFVSHDTYFIEKIAQRKWFFRNNTIVETEQSLQEMFAEKEEASKLDKSRKIKTTEQNINPIILKKKYNQIEKKTAEIDHQNELIEILESEFQKPETFKNDQKIKNLNREIKDRKDMISELEKELELLEHEYLELSV